MSAKRKLNRAHVTGSLLVAGRFGLATGSLAVFVVALAALLAVGYYAGHLRR